MEIQSFPESQKETIAETVRNVSVLFFCVINELLKGKEKKPHLQSDDGHDDDGRHRCHTCSRKASQLVYLSHPSLLSISFLFFFFLSLHPTNLTLPTGVYVVCWKMYLYKKKRWCADSFMAPRRKKKKRIKESSYCVCV